LGFFRIPGIASKHGDFFMYIYSLILGSLLNFTVVYYTFEKSFYAWLPSVLLSFLISMLFYIFFTFYRKSFRFVIDRSIKNMSEMNYEDPVKIKADYMINMSNDKIENFRKKNQEIFTDMMVDVDQIDNFSNDIVLISKRIRTDADGLKELVGEVKKNSEFISNY